MGSSGLAGRDFISMLDFTPAEIETMLGQADAVKAEPSPYADALAGQTLFMYFEKPSLRTRATFEAGMTQMGGHAIYYSAADGKIGERESVADVARNLERWVAAVMCRTFSHRMVQELAQQSAIPVINGLTDFLHPCQALADFQTLREARGRLRDCRLVYIGDGNNMAHALMEAGARTGCHVTVITPPGHEPSSDHHRACTDAASETGARIEVSNDLAAVEGADAVYTDVWASMGQEAEAAARRKTFQAYQVNPSVMQRAGADAIFLHCLPAHRGEEVTDEVAESPASWIFPQAENRLHAHKALLLLLLGAV